jgi:hypothetical protein
MECIRPMPPTTVIDGERLINVGIADPETGENQIVGVSFKNNKAVKYANNAPPTALATPMPAASQMPARVQLAKVLLDKPH